MDWVQSANATATAALRVPPAGIVQNVATAQQLPTSAESVAALFGGTSGFVSTPDVDPSSQPSLLHRAVAHNQGQPPSTQGRVRERTTPGQRSTVNSPEANPPKLQKTIPESSHQFDDLPPTPSEDAARALDPSLTSKSCQNQHQLLQMRHQQQQQ